MFVKLTNGKPSTFPYTLGDLRRDNPATSFPQTFSDEVLQSFDVYSVKQSAAPAFDNKTHRVTQWVELIEGEWTQTWQVQQLPEQLASDNIRADRNKRLADCDWTGLTDCQLDAGDKVEWAAYREDLRLVPQQFDFPWAVTWPVKPGDS
jgi:hypothetical protein